MNPQRQKPIQLPDASRPRSSQRAGLAPLELVLALPLLLCVMALIVNFAHAATWKIRSATAARLAMWRHRPMWDADMDPKPTNFWPKSATMNVGGTSRISQVDPIWNQPRIAQGWIKGPAFVANGGILEVRDNRVNEMSEGVAKGTSAVSMKYPFLPSMGKMVLNAETSLLDHVWQFHTMGYPWNHSRRAKGWWVLENSPEWFAQRELFQRADQVMVMNPQAELLRPLDRDLELIKRGYAFDFYPRANPGCTNDFLQVREYVIKDGGFLDRITGNKKLRIPGAAERMARSYLQMYQDLLDQQKAQPNPSADAIAQLEQWIRELIEFIQKLQQ